MAQGPAAYSVTRRFGAFGAGTAAAFAVAFTVFIAASIAAAGDLDRAGRASGGEFERAAEAVESAKAALQAFDAWRAGAARGASSRREASLENRFHVLLDRAEARAASTPTRAAAAALRAAHAQWRAAEPLDARFAALEPALDEARAVKMRLHLSLMVETAVTQSLYVQRSAVVTASRAKWTSVVAALAAMIAAGALLVGAAKMFIVRFGAVRVKAPSPSAAPVPRRETAEAEAMRRKATARLAAIRAFEAERRVRTDLPFALRGASPMSIEG